MLFEKFSKKHTTLVAIYSFVLSFVISYFFSFDFSNLRLVDFVGLLIHLASIVLYVVNYNIDKKVDFLLKDVRIIKNANNNTNQKK